MIPRHPEQVTRQWLSTVLSSDHSSVDVLDVQAVAIGTGQMGATYRLTLRYGSNPNGLPPTLVLKLPAQDDTVRERSALGYRSEVAFYARMLDVVQIPAPRCFHAEATPDGTDFVLLLGDMGPAVQGDQIAGCTADEARLAVIALARLHGPTWCDPRWLSLEEVAMPKPGDDAAATVIAEVATMATTITLEGLGSRLSEEDKGTLAATTQSILPWLLAEPDRFALMHGDYRLDNLLFTPQRDRIAVVDWQTLGVGLPARDLAFFLGTGLSPETRARTERELVGDYYAELISHGVANYSYDMCWQDYRLGMLQVPLISTLGWAFGASTSRGDDMVVTMLSRGCQAIRELGTLDLVARMPV